MSWRNIRTRITSDQLHQFGYFFFVLSLLFGQGLYRSKLTQRGKVKRFYFVPDYAYLWEAKAGIAIHYKKFIRKLENIYETYGDTKFEGSASM